MAKYSQPLTAAESKEKYALKGLLRRQSKSEVPVSVPGTPAQEMAGSRGLRLRGRSRVRND